MARWTYLGVIGNERDFRALLPHSRRRVLGGTSLRVLDLETQIDDCLTFARGLDKEGLAGVIAHLRDARNAVVWKLG